MNTNNQVNLEMVEVSLHSQLQDALIELEQMPQWQLVIGGYLKDKALAQVNLLGEPAIVTRGDRPKIYEDLLSISNLNYHLNMIHKMGNAAKADIMDEYGPEVED